MNLAQLPNTNSQQLWNFIVPAVVVVGIVGSIVVAAWQVWSVLRRNFADKDETKAQLDEAKIRLTKLEVTSATADKLNGKLDTILKLFSERKRRD